MFRDGRRKIDMILCYEEEDEGVMTEIEAKRRENRSTFMENLVKEGLELEVEDKSQSFDEKTCFIKIHMPWKTETRYAEVLNLKLPIKRFITISVKAWVYYFCTFTTQNLNTRKIHGSYETHFFISHSGLSVYMNETNINYKFKQDEEKNDVLKLNTIRRWLRKFKKLTELDPLLLENEPTFFSATAGGTPEEQ